MPMSAAFLRPRAAKQYNVFYCISARLLTRYFSVRLLQSTLTGSFRFRFWSWELPPPKWPILCRVGR